MDELDDRLGIARNGTKKFLDKIFPDHWSFLLGEIALYSFVVLVVTGIFLALYFVPSATKEVYTGPYRPLDGTPASEAFNSVMRISFQVRAGLLVRQMHHWAADIFIGAIVVHVSRIFFTSAYRKPRDTNWFIGVTMLILAIMNGYVGYSLPDDLLSGTGVRIGFSIILSIPFVGSYLAFFLFRGNFPGTAYIPRFFLFHVLVIPLLIIGLLGAHLGLVFRQKHTQWPGKHRTERNVVGSPMFPIFMAKTMGLLLMTAGLITLVATFFQTDAIWATGPYNPSSASTAAQPDWYMGWLEGALRLMPSWETAVLGHTIVWAVFIPAVVLPTATFVFLYAWPVLMRYLGREDNEAHHLLIAPRQRPLHTAVGTGFFAFYFMLFLSGSDDVLSNFLHISLNDTVLALRIAVFAIPLLVALATTQICRDLQGIPPRRSKVQRARVLIRDGSHYEVFLEQAEHKAPLAPAEVPDHIVGITDDPLMPKAASPGGGS